MKLQHIQLEDYNIIVSDEEIKGSDISFYSNKFGANYLCLAVDTKDGRVYHELGVNAEKEYGTIEGGITPLKSEIFKLISSTNPEDNLPSIDYNGFEERFGIIDVEKLAKDFSNEGAWQCPVSFEKGFKKCQELNDKKFSLEDMERARLHGQTNGSYKWEEFIQSLQQPKVTDVEVEMEPYKSEISDYSNHLDGLFPKKPKITNNKVKITKII